MCGLLNAMGRVKLMIMEINIELAKLLLQKAKENPRLRQNLDMRTSPADTSQRMLNALLPGTQVPIHRHEDTSETVICLCGRMEEIFYEQVTDAEGNVSYTESERFCLCPKEGFFGCQVPKGVWHRVEVKEPSVIFEAKDGAYKG